jgi:hypothetical protein
MVNTKSWRLERIGKYKWDNAKAKRVDTLARAFNDKSRKIQIFVAKKHLNHRLSKWLVWEYLPWWLANIPVYAFFAWFALRARHLFFFTNVNPDIPLGGAMGESKSGILQLLPPEIVPPWVLIPAGVSWEDAWRRLQQSGIGFPLIAKPDVGERGFLVKKIHTQEELRLHLEVYPVDFIIQAFLPHPLEMTVLFHRFPGQSRVSITSVCVKEFLSVRGDGQATVAELMARDLRSALQLPRFQQQNPALMEAVLPDGEQLLLEPIGNHIRGTKFLNGNHLIDADLETTFSEVCRSMNGVLYGRFDLKTHSPEALRQGEFQVMELNGVLGEPAHVYDPAFGMWRAYRDLYRHWHILYRLHRAQKRAGIYPDTHRKAWALMQEYFSYKKKAANE